MSRAPPRWQTGSYLQQSQLFSSESVNGELRNIADSLAHAIGAAVVGRAIVAERISVDLPSSILTIPRVGGSRMIRHGTLEHLCSISRKRRLALAERRSRHMCWIHMIIRLGATVLSLEHLWRAPRIPFESGLGQRTLGKSA